MNRYLKHQRWLTRQALARLVEEDQPDPDALEVAHALEEERVEERIGLNEQRLGAVVAALQGCGAKRVLDLGCGEGRLLRALLQKKAFEEIVGLDVSHRALERFVRREPLYRVHECVFGVLALDDRKACPRGS